MPPIKQAPLPEKPKIHPRNLHKERYDIKLLVQTCPELAPFVTLNIHKDETIDFANPDAVKILNQALLKQYYGIDAWDIPPGYLCPPIPGRADYIHHLSDLLAGVNFGKIPTGEKVIGLDIGVGANCVYPIIGHASYGWSFIGSDIDPVAIESAEKIIADNPSLTGFVTCRLQPNPKEIFNNILQKGETIDFCMCNPPFHANIQEAETGTLRKLSNLKGKKVVVPVQNFGGQFAELCYEGGEAAFVENMAQQSRLFGGACFWFSTLVSKQSNLKRIYEALKKERPTEVRTIAMGHGNKTSRIVAWTFLSKDAQKAWRNARWKNFEQKNIE